MPPADRSDARVDLPLGHEFEPCIGCTEASGRDADHCRHCGKNPSAHRPASEPERPNVETCPHGGIFTYPDCCYPEPPALAQGSLESPIEHVETLVASKDGMEFCTASDKCVCFCADCKQRGWHRRHEKHVRAPLQPEGSPDEYEAMARDLENRLCREATTAHRQSMLAAALRSVAQKAEAETWEEAAKIAETPTGGYQVGTKSLPYWDGAKLAEAFRHLAAAVRARG